VPQYQGALTLTTTGTSGAATLVGTTLNIPQYSGGGGTPAGNAGEIQFNSTPAGSFAASSNLAWDNTNVRLNIGDPSSPTARFNVKGSGNLSGTVNLRLTDSGNTELFRVLDNGDMNGKFTWAFPFYNGSNGDLRTNRVGNVSNGLFIQVVGAPDFSAGNSAIYLGDRAASNQCTQTSGNNVGVTAMYGYSPTSGTGTFAALRLNTIINQTGGSNGITRGLYVNPTLTAAADWRSIEFSNNSGYGLYGAGTANNYLAGNTVIGTTTPSARLHSRGSDASSGTNAFLVQNSTPDDIYKIENNGKITYWATNTAAGTTAPQTIDKPSGTINFAAADVTKVVTNALCTTSSIVFATVRTADATAYIKNVVPGAGSFTIELGAAATAETSVGFFIIN